MLAFTTGIALVTCLLCGLAPALRLARTEPGDVMKAGGRGLTARPEGSRFQRLLVVTQIAVSLVLVVGALLFARSFQKLLSVDAGFRQDGILFAFCDLTPRNLQPAAFAAAKAAILDRIRALPQVEGAGSSTKIPLTRSSWTMGSASEGRTAKDDWSKVSWVSPGFFHALDVPVLAGRDFTRADTATLAEGHAGQRDVRLAIPEGPSGHRHPSADGAGAWLSRDRLRDRRRRPRRQILRSSGRDSADELRSGRAASPTPRPWMAVVVRTSGDAGCRERGDPPCLQRRGRDGTLR